jgi:hypothetical protein
LGAGFEYGEKVREAKKLADGLAEIDELQLALRVFGGKIEPYEGPKSGAIHAGERGEIESDVLFVRQHRFDLSLEQRGIFCGEPTGAIHEYRVGFPADREIEMRSGRGFGISWHRIFRAYSNRRIVLR